MRWNRWTVQPFLDVRAAVLNGTLEGMFRRRYPDFCPANRTVETAAAARRERDHYGKRPARSPDRPSL
jgi:hypothetical protein